MSSGAHGEADEPETLEDVVDGLLADYPHLAPITPKPRPSSAPLPEFDPDPKPAPPILLRPPELPNDAKTEPGPAPDRAPRIRPDLRIPTKAEARTLPRPKPGATIGIDLGTTNCCAAVVRDGQAFVLASRTGGPTTPSVVSFERSGEVYVGEDAVARASVDPLNTVVGSKRMVGRPFHSPIVQGLRAHFAYSLVAGEEGEAAVDITDEIVSLEQVAGYLLREIKEAASLQLGEDVTRAVVTCPAFYNERQREAVRVAGELAGLKVERVLSEPTAAALNYGFGQQLETRRIAVYDLGGGTFDVSILEVDGSVYEVLATGGDTFLGGIDFDAAVAELIVRAMVDSGAPDPRRDASAVARIMQYAETAKMTLSERRSTIVNVRSLSISGAPPVTMSVPVVRSDVERQVAPLLEQTKAIVREVCARAGVSPTDVDDVLLVGGQTRSPAVRRAVAEVFGREPKDHVHPDEAVALGAAQYAAGMQTIDNVVLIDALAMSIGVGLPGGRFFKILERDARLPARGRCILPTAEPNQEEMEIWFFQGDGHLVHLNEPLGSLRVCGLPPGPIGSVSVRVDLTVTEESILEVKATESATGRAFTSRFATKATPDHLQPKQDQPAEEGTKNVWKWLTGLFKR